MSKQIASVNFSEVAAARPLYGGYYKIPAVKKGAEPNLLTIEDKIQRSQEPGPDGKTRQLVRYMVTAREIAADILMEWTASSVGQTPDCHPGIWIVRDELPELNADGSPVFDADHKAVWRPATAKEKNEMWLEDLEANRIFTANWAEWLIRQGDVLAEDPKQWVLISKLMRAAAVAYGKERPWLQELKDSDIKHCQWCTKAIAIQSVICPNCQQIVDPERYARMKAAQDSLVSEVGKGKQPARVSA